MNDDEFHWGAGQLSIRIVFVILFCIGVPFFIYSMYLFYKRIKMFPIKDRTPRLVILGDTFLLMFYAITCIRAWNFKEFPCGLFYFSRLFFNAVCLSLYIIRLLYVYYKFQLTVELAGEWTRSTLVEKRRMEESRAKTVQIHANIQSTFHHHSGRAIDNVGWYSKHRYLLHGHNIAKIHILISIIFAIPGIIWFIADSNFSKVNAGRCLHSADIYTTALLFAVLLLFMIIAWQMREVVEGYRLVFEFKITCLFVLLFYIIWQIGKSTQHYFPIHVVASLGLVTSVMFWSTVYPVILSRKYQSDTLTRISSQSEAIEILGTLQGTLDHPEMRQLFMEHLCREFSVENLFFLDETQRWYNRVLESRGENNNNNKTPAHSRNPTYSISTHKQKRSISKSIKKLERINQELWQIAIHIYEYFIETDAPYQVNIPHSIRVNIANELRRGYNIPKIGPHDKRASRLTNNTSSQMDMMELSIIKNDGSTTSLPVNTIDLPPVPVDLFVQANKCIFDLLQRDSFPRFVMTPDARNLLREVIKAKKLERQYSKVSAKIHNDK